MTYRDRGAASSVKRCHFSQSGAEHMKWLLVVVIGGVGSFPGAVLGGLIAGEIISLTSMVNPGYSYVMLFVAMTLVLVLRPYGLLGAAGRE